MTVRLIMYPRIAGKPRVREFKGPHAKTLNDLFPVDLDERYEFVTIQWMLHGKVLQETKWHCEKPPVKFPGPDEIMERVITVTEVELESHRDRIYQHLSDPILMAKDFVGYGRYNLFFMGMRLNRMTSDALEQELRSVGWNYVEICPTEGCVSIYLGKDANEEV